MKLDKAIEVLTLENKHPWNNDNSDLRNAVKLGIEALKSKQEARRYGVASSVILLPGETN